MLPQCVRPSFALQTVQLQHEHILLCTDSLKSIPLSDCRGRSDFRVRPLGLRESRESSQTHPWGVDWALAGVDEDIVQEATERASEEWSNHWYLRSLLIILYRRCGRAERAYPEVVSASREHFRTISKSVAHNSWAKVTGQVDSISGLPTEACTNTEDDKEQTERREVAGTNVRIVLECVNAEHEDCASDEFRKEHAGARHECRGVGAEDTSGGVLSQYLRPISVIMSNHLPRNAYSSNAVAALELVNGRLVVAVDNASGAESSQSLSNGVDWELSPWELSVDAVRKCDSGVQVSTRFTSNILYSIRRVVGV